MNNKLEDSEASEAAGSDAQPVAVVGMGASAGGLEAIEAFFKAMPGDSGMAFVVIQHLSPDYKSLMVELLSRKTPMPVHRAEDGMRVRRNHIYLIPPKKNLTLFHGKLLLEDQGRREGINLPVDIFLRSLAEDQGERAVAVILSGTGSDGTRGVRAIKGGGGLVMVQDEESAKFDGMPRAAMSTGLADFVLPPEEMPSQLLACLRHPYAVRQVRQEESLAEETGLTRVFSLLRTKTRVDFTFYKVSTIARRIERRIAVTQVADLDAYVRYLEQTPSEISALYRELLIGVTSFFRDPEVMTVLEEKVLPEVFEQGIDRELRFWVAGCSTGEEAYTLAILAREVMERLQLVRDLKIFATDLDRDAVARAGTGVYPESIAADLNPSLLTKYFHRRGDRYHIARTIREMVVFAQHNLVKDPPFTRMDLVSCRNLLIYLQSNLQQRALEMFSFSLRPGGVLLLGTSETVGEMDHLFHPLDRKARIYRLKGKAHPWEGVRAADSARTNHAAPLPLAVAGHLRTMRAGSREQERLLVRLLDLMAASYVPLAVVVNEHLEVLYTVGDPSGVFTLPSGRAVYDISKMVNRELAVPLATGIQKVFRSGEEMVYTNMRLRESDTVRTICLRFRPLPGRKSDEALVAVLFERIEENEAPSDSAVPVYDLDEDARQRLQDLEQELQFTRENLQATIEELETSNEELQATNEELLASNEELQSTNEELQSANEELYTVNTEYQNKIIELTEARNDIDNLLSSSRIGTLLLDEDLCVRRYSLQAAEIFHLVDGDIGRPLHHLAHRLPGFSPVDMAGEVLRDGLPLEREVQDEDGHWFLVRILPYQVGPEAVAGVVFTFVDISPLRDVRERLEDARKTAADIVQHMPSGLFVYDVLGPDELVLSSGNAAAESISGLDVKKYVGSRFEELWPGERGVELKELFLEAFRENKPVRVPEIEYEDERFSGVFHVHAFRLPGNRLAVGFEDVTARRRAEEALQESEAMLARSQEVAHVGSWTLDLRSGDLSWSEETYRIFGLSPEEFEGSYEAFLECVHPDDRAAVEAAYSSSLKEGKDTYEIEHRLIHRSGKVRYVLERCVHERDEGGEVVRSIGMVEDITEQRFAAQRLARSEERYRCLYQMLADAEKTAQMGSWSWEVSTDTVTWSDNLFRLFGREPVERAPSFAEHDSLYTPESLKRLCRAVKEALEKGLTYQMELDAVRADGAIVRCVARGQVEHDETGVVQRLYGSLQAREVLE